MQLDPASRFVFLDHRGHRWPRFRRLVFWSAVVLAISGMLFLAAVWIRPELRLPAMVRELKGRLKADAKAANWRRPAGQERPPKVRPPSTAAGGVRLGFFVDSDPNAMISLRAHA